VSHFTHTHTYLCQEGEALQYNSELVSLLLCILDTATATGQPVIQDIVSFPTVLGMRPCSKSALRQHRDLYMVLHGSVVMWLSLPSPPRKQCSSGDPEASDNAAAGAPLYLFLHLPHLLLTSLPPPHLPTSLPLPILPPVCIPAAEMTSANLQPAVRVQR